MEKLEVFIKGAFALLGIYPSVSRFRRVPFLFGLTNITYETEKEVRFLKSKYRDQPLKIIVYIDIVDIIFEFLEINKFREENLFKGIRRLDKKIANWLDHFYTAHFYEISNLLPEVQKVDSQNRYSDFLDISEKQEKANLKFLQAHKLIKGKDGILEHLFGLNFYSIFKEGKKFDAQPNQDDENELLQFVFKNVTNKSSLCNLILLRGKALFLKENWREIVKIDPNFPNEWRIRDEELILKRIISHHENILKNPNKKIAAFSNLMHNGKAVNISKKLSDAYCNLIIDIFETELNPSNQAQDKSGFKKATDNQSSKTNEKKENEFGGQKKWLIKKESLARILTELFSKKIILGPSGSLKKKYLPMIACPTFGIDNLAASSFSIRHIPYNDDEFFVPENNISIEHLSYKTADRFIWLASPTLFCALFYQLHKLEIFDLPDIVKFGMDHFYFQEEGKYFDETELEAILKKDMGKVSRGLKINVLKKDL